MVGFSIKACAHQGRWGSVLLVSFQGLSGYPGNSQRTPWPVGMRLRGWLHSLSCVCASRAPQKSQDGSYSGLGHFR